MMIRFRMVQSMNQWINECVWLLSGATAFDRIVVVDRSKQCRVVPGIQEELDRRWKEELKSSGRGRDPDSGCLQGDGALVSAISKKSRLLLLLEGPWYTQGERAFHHRWAHTKRCNQKVNGTSILSMQRFLLSYEWLLSLEFQRDGLQPYYYYLGELLAGLLTIYGSNTTTRPSHVRWQILVLE